MYLDFMRALCVYIEKLKEAIDEIDETKAVPYVDRVPVMLDGELVGWLVDDIGGEFQYELSTPEEQEWWDSRPWQNE